MLLPLHSRCRHSAPPTLLARRGPHTGLRPCSSATLRRVGHSDSDVQGVQARLLVDADAVPHTPQPALHVPRPASGLMSAARWLPAVEPLIRGPLRSRPGTSLVWQLPWRSQPPHRQIHRAAQGLPGRRRWAAGKRSRLIPAAVVRQGGPCHTQLRQRQARPGAPGAPSGESPSSSGLLMVHRICDGALHLGDYASQSLLESRQTATSCYFPSHTAPSDPAMRPD